MPVCISTPSRAKNLLCFYYIITFCRKTYTFGNIDTYYYRYLMMVLKVSHGPPVWNQTLRGAAGRRQFSTIPRVNYTLLSYRTLTLVYRACPTDSIHTHRESVSVFSRRAPPPRKSTSNVSPENGNVSTTRRYIRRTTFYWIFRAPRYPYSSH